MSLYKYQRCNSKNFKNCLIQLYLILQNTFEKKRSLESIISIVGRCLPTLTNLQMLLQSVTYVPDKAIMTDTRE